MHLANLFKHLHKSLSSVIRRVIIIAAACKYDFGSSLPFLFGFRLCILLRGGAKLTLASPEALFELLGGLSHKLIALGSR